MPRVRKRKKFSELSKRSKYIIIIGLIGVAAPMILLAFAPFVFTRTWLTIDVGEFVDNVDDGDVPLEWKLDSYALTDFVKTYSEYLGNGTYAYYGDFTFKYTSAVHTHLTKEDMFKNLQSVEHSERWLNYRVYDWANLVSSNSWYVEWNSLEWGDEEVITTDPIQLPFGGEIPGWEFHTGNYDHKINNYVYDGYFPITLSINDDLSGLIGQQLNGTTITGAEFVYAFTEVGRLSSDIDWTFGSYQDIYTDVGPSEGTVNVEVVNPHEDTGIAADKGAAYISSLNLGWDAGSLYSEDITVQQGEVYAPGVTLNPSTSGPISFNVPYKIKPHASYVQRNIHIRPGVISYERAYFPGVVEDPSSQYAGTYAKPDLNEKQIVSVRVDNVLVKETYQVSGTIVATIQYDAELSEIDWEDPIFEQNDVVWDVSMDGSSEAQLTLHSTAWEDFWAGVGEFFMSGFNMLITVMVLIGVILGLYLAIKIVRRRR